MVRRVIEEVRYLVEYVFKKVGLEILPFSIKVSLLLIFVVLPVSFYAVILFCMDHNEVPKVKISKKSV